MADVLSFRLRQRPVRMAAAISTLAVSFFYLLAQMAGAGGLVALLLGVDGTTGQSVVVAIVGILMIVYVLVGGMKGTTYVQIIKASLLIIGAAIMTVWVLGKAASTSRTCSARPPRRPPRARRSSTRALSTARRRRPRSTSSRCRWPWSSAPPACRTCSCASTRCRRPRRPVAPASGRSGSSASSTCSPWCSATARACARRAKAINAAPGKANSAAPLLAYELGGTVLLASSPGSPSPRSSRSSPG